jgi:hypothetical protein
MTDTKDRVISEQETRIIDLPTVHQRACELPGGPLIAILVGLQNHIATVLDDLRVSAFSTVNLGKAKGKAIRGAIGMAVGMYYTPNMNRLDPEAYAVEMSETCLSMLLCQERCAEAFEQAVELEGGAVSYRVKVLAPPSPHADLSCLSVLRDLPHIHVVIKRLEDERSWTGNCLREEDCE